MQEFEIFLNGTKVKVGSEQVYTKYKDCDETSTQVVSLTIDGNVIIHIKNSDKNHVKVVYDS